MKIYRLNIETDNSELTYNKITNLLGQKPTELRIQKKSDEKYGLWIYSLEENEEETPIDFITVFLDIIESKYNELIKLGVTKNNITFWLLYEYDQQCNMEFHPQEMKRLGEAGIVLCIDCWAK